MADLMLTRRSALLGATGLAALVACGQDPRRVPPPATDSAARWLSGVANLAVAEDADVAGTVSGLWAFADRFAEILPSGQNTVFSPASLGYAFGMLRGAADGDTAQQLDAVFRFPPSLHEAFAVMRRDIVTSDGPPSGKAERAEVAIANGLFLLPRLKVDPEYQTLITETYGAELQRVELNTPQALEVLNAWVKEQTAGRIDKLFGKLPPNTIAVLANAVYLKALWVMQFDAGLTQDEPFKLADGGSVSAPMMRLPKPDMFRYARADDWHAVELPYQGDELAMWVVVPTEGRQPPRISADTLKVLGAAETVEVDVYLPRWDFGQVIELLPELRKLGLTDLDDLPAFGDGSFVGDAIHRANITVDESGTEAAAVTGIAVAVSAPQIEATVKADRPFTYAVVHKPTGMPMFVGTVTDPTAT